MNINKALFAFIKIAFSVMVVLFVVYGIVTLAGQGYDYGYRFFTETAVDPKPGEDVLVRITEDMSAHDIGKLLESKGLIRDEKLFFMRLKLSAYSKSIEPGTYTLNTSMTPKEMMVAMSPQEETQTGTEAAGTEETKE